MNGRQVIRTPLSSALTQLYGYIYCMLVSNIVVGMPLFGGALYLCGRAGVVFFSVYSKKNRKYLPAHSRRWGIALGVLLGMIAVLLMGLYPAGFQSPQIWIMFAAVLLCLIADGLEGRIRRLRENDGPASRHAWGATFALQALLIGAMALIMFTAIGGRTAAAMTIGFAVLLLLRSRTAMILYTETEPEGEEKAEEAGKITQLKAYRVYEIISLTIIAATEMIVSAIYALLATNTESLLPALMIGVGCALLSAGVAVLFLRKSRTTSRQNPTWLLCVGTGLCFVAVTVCSIMLKKGAITWQLVYACLAACSVGSTFSMAGLRKTEDLMPAVAELSGEKVSRAYGCRREMNWQLAQLLGDTASLIALSVFCFLNGTELPKDISQLAARFQPVMIIPVMLVVLAALIGAFRFPLSDRYIEKLKLFLKLKRQGENNPVLEKRLQEVMNKPYRQPWLTRFLCMILRPIMHHRLVNEDHIIVDEKNPLLFLCNHGELSGPVSAKLFMPVPIRYWVSSNMMFDRKAVTDYLYRNTYSRQTYMPVFLRKAVARFMGWLSVTVTKQIEGIPVYRDSPMKLRETVRMSIDAMAMGDNLMIFPENPEGKYQKGGIGELAPGFLMLAEAYWKKTGKKLRILPVYENWKERTISFGEILTYEPEKGFHEEQERIIRETRDQINRMAGYGVTEHATA